MPVDLSFLAKRLKPENTLLLFGAGSSIPSGAPSGNELVNKLTTALKHRSLEGFSLVDAAGILEKKLDRRQLITALQSVLLPLKPTRGLLNLPMLEWREIYTTNYDELLEQVFEKAKKPFSVISSNYDLTNDSIASGTPIYKIHGTIRRDTSLGDRSRIIITQQDYDQSARHRQSLYDRFKDQLNRSDLIIIGYSLADPDLKEVIDRALTLKGEGTGGTISLLLYQEDYDRASLYEDRGLQVCFGGIDEFVDSAVAAASGYGAVVSSIGDFFDQASHLRTSFFDVSHALASEPQNVGRLFQGAPASYGDIARGATFKRDMVPQIQNSIKHSAKAIAVVMGVAGVGKTTLCRQTMAELSSDGLYCWEHDDNRPLDGSSWLKVARELKSSGKLGVLFIDDCHEHFRQLNILAEGLVKEGSGALKLLLSTNPASWNPRIKSPEIFANGSVFRVRQLSTAEVDDILNLVDRNSEIRALVEPKFLGFDRADRRNRLFDRCGADTFVCMKNIFGFDSIDEIILREYAELHPEYRDVYRFVAALDAGGVKVHRQFLIRVLNLKSSNIPAILANLSGTISEATVDEKTGIYTWSGRHPVISEIISKNEFSDQDELFKLFCDVADNINPTYKIEMRTVKELCGRNYGIARLRDVDKQNVVLRKLISSAPIEPVPRHRLISNLIEQKDFSVAESEIRIYEKEFRVDPVITRLKIVCAFRRAEANSTILPEHRANMARDAAQMAEMAISRFPDFKGIYDTYLQIGRFVFMTTGKWDVFDVALERARNAEGKILDPDMTRFISKFEQWESRAKSTED